VRRWIVSFSRVLAGGVLDTVAFLLLPFGASGEYLLHLDGISCQKNRRRTIPFPKHSMFPIRIAIQHKHSNGLNLRINNPVFRDASSGVIRSLFDIIPLMAVWPIAHNFKHQIRADRVSL
jgi:hypothetical protein